MFTTLPQGTNSCLMYRYITKFKHLTLLERLERKTVKEPTGCWVWKGGCDTWGHGRMMAFHRKSHVHRFSWELFRGQIPPGIDVLHKCDNPPCWNPDHLFLGTQTDNNRDRDMKNRQSKGMRNHKSTLTDDDVKRMREMYSTGNYSTRALAEFFPVKYAAVWQIVSGRAWKHLS